MADSKDFIHIDIKVDGMTTLRIPINKHKTTADLFRVIRGRDEMKGIRFETMVLVGEPILESNVGTLESNGFKNLSTAYLCLTAHGGSSDASKPEASSVFVRWTTTEPCCVTDDDDPGVKRAKMPCGCVIGTEALKRHCEEKAKMGRFGFPCAKCNKIWPNKAVSEALSAAIPVSEIESFTKKVNQNYFSGSAAFKTCPFCGAYVKRDPSWRFLNVNWVECPACTKKKGSSVTFCWSCDKAWMGGTSTSCGNSGCDGKDPRIKVLQSCGTADIQHISVAGVPKCRACVDCGRILEHSGGCKHMSCPCGCEFCFVCLKKKMKVGSFMLWQCGAYDTACSVAPRQEVIFDFKPITKD